MDYELQSNSLTLDYQVLNIGNQALVSVQYFRCIYKLSGQEPYMYKLNGYTLSVQNLACTKFDEFGEF